MPVEVDDARAPGVTTVEADHLHPGSDERVTGASGQVTPWADADDHKRSGPDDTKGPRLPVQIRSGAPGSHNEPVMSASADPNPPDGCPSEAELPDEGCPQAAEG
jgi:hypothetical protein